MIISKWVCFCRQCLNCTVCAFFSPFIWASKKEHLVWHIFKYLATTKYILEWNNTVKKAIFFMRTVLFGKLRVRNAFRVSLPHSACYSVACQWCIRPPRSSWGYCLHGHCPQCWRRLAAWSCRKEKVSSCVLAWWLFNFWRSFKTHLFFYSGKIAWRWHKVLHSCL